MDLKLKNKVVLITGGTGGIGSAIVEDFLKEGAKVILLYRNEDKKNKLFHYLLESTGSIDKLTGVKLDITNKEQIRLAIEDILGIHQCIDVLVNCAGFANEKPFLMLQDDEIDHMLELNFTSALWLSRAVLRPMFKQRRGSIINISSLSTHAWGRGITVYAAAKAALERFSQTLAQEVGKKGIRVNVVCPGVIETDMSINVRSALSDIILQSTASNKYGKPKEVSKAVVFLASEETASFINGHILKVDGGFNL